MTSQVEPWRLEDLVAAAVIAIVGTAQICAAWLGAGRQVTLGQQSAWLALGIGGSIVIAFACAFWIAVGHRSVGLRRVALTPTILGARGADVPAHGLAPTTTDDYALSGPGMHYYHRSGCVFTEGKPGLEPLRPTDAVRWGLAPCRACHDIDGTTQHQ